MMKKRFNLIERVQFIHGVEVKLEDEQEEEFEEFCSSINLHVNDKMEVVNQFVDHYGSDKITFEKDMGGETEFDT